MIGVVAQAVLWVALAAGVHFYTNNQLPWVGRSADQELERFSCRPFLPKLFVDTPPSLENPAIRDASRQLETFLSGRFAQGDIDGLSVAVVTSAGPIFESNWGVQRGNESSISPPMTSHSIHRISSVTKIFPILEGLVLEQQGIISW